MDLARTTELYRNKIQEVSKGGRTANLDEFQDGRVTRNLLEQGHLPEHIEQAVIKFSPVAFKQANAEESPVSQKEYAANLIDKGQNVIKALQEIKEYNAATPESETLDGNSEYKRLAKREFEQKKEVFLNSRLDTDIAFKMLGNGYSKDDIEKAVFEVSPVAKEAGRSPKDYSEYVTDRAVESWKKYVEKQKAMEVNYQSTAKEYFERKEAVKAAIKEGRSAAYQDGRIVRELIGKGHEAVNLTKAIAETAVVKEGKKPENYARYIVKGVIAEIRAEQNILNFDVNAIAKDEPLSLTQEYQRQAKEIFERNSKEAFNPSIDTHVATELIKNNYDPGKIKEVISELSPAGKRPGMALDYPDKVIERANERIVYDQKLGKDYPAVVMAYIDNAERIKQANPGRNYSEYFDGKIAQRLLENGYAKENVQKVLSEVSFVANNLQQEKGWDIERYGKSVVYRTMESMARQEAAKSLEPKENPELKAPSVKEEYQHHLKAYIDKNINLTANTDVQISKKLLTQGYCQDEIKKAILEASPVAIEAGRKPESYVQYVQKNVEQFLEKQQSNEIASDGLPERDKRISELSTALPNPEENSKKMDVKKDYNREAAQLIAAEKGWSGPESDIKIAQSLLLKGYKEEQVRNAISKLSPETADKSDVDAFKYSHQTVKKSLTSEVKKEIKKEANSISKGKALKV